MTLFFNRILLKYRSQIFLKKASVLLFFIVTSPLFHMLIHFPSDSVLDSLRKRSSGNWKFFNFRKQILAPQPHLQLSLLPVIAFQMDRREGQVFSLYWHPQYRKQHICHSRVQSKRIVEFEFYPQKQRTIGNTPHK